MLKLKKTVFGITMLLIVVCLIFLQPSSKEVDLDKYNPKQINLMLSMKDIEVYNTLKNNMSSIESRTIDMIIEEGQYKAKIDNISDYLIDSNYDKDKISFELEIKDKNDVFNADKLNFLGYSDEKIQEAIKLSKYCRAMGLNVAKTSVANISINGIEKGKYLLVDKYNKGLLKKQGKEEFAIVKVSNINGKKEVKVIDKNSKKENELVKEICKEIVVGKIGDELANKDLKLKLAAIEELIGKVNMNSLYFYVDLDNEDMDMLVDSGMVLPAENDNLIDLSMISNEDIKKYIASIDFETENQSDDDAVNVFSQESGTVIDEFLVNGNKAIVNNDKGIIFVSLKAFTNPLCKINYKVNDNSKVSFINDKKERVLVEDSSNYDFKKFIFNGQVCIQGCNKTYDLVVTTGNTDVVIIDTTQGEQPEIQLKDKIKCKMLYAGVNDTEKYNAMIEYYNDREQPKKDYSIKLLKGDSVKSISSGQRIVLEGNDYDESFIRKKLASDIIKEYSNVDKYKTEYVEVIVNGDYKGLYLIAPKIDDQFLNISEFDKERPKDSSVIFRANDINADFKSENTVLNLHNQKYRHFPKGLQPKKKDKDMLLGWHSGYKQLLPDVDKYGERWYQLENLVKFVATSTDVEFEDNVFKLVDEQDYENMCALLQIIGSDNLSVQKQFIYRNEGVNEKFKFIPNDFNHIFGRSIELNLNTVDKMYTNGLFKRVVRIPSFSNDVDNKMYEIAKKMSDSNFVATNIEEYKLKIRQAQSRNYWRWHRSYANIKGINEYGNKISEISNWLENRLNWVINNKR